MVGSNLESEKMTDYITYLFKYFLTFHYFFFQVRQFLKLMTILYLVPKPQWDCSQEGPVERFQIGPATYVVGIILSPGVPFDNNHGKCLIFPSLRLSVTYVDDVFWGQPIKLIQVVLLHNFMNIDGMKLIIDFDFQVPAT